MADLPIGALPGFADDVEYLATRGICIERFEDHHPYTSELQAMMERLVANGKLGLLSLSGPRQDAELAEAELQCGTDMVYHSTIAGQPWTTPGVAELRAAAHGEDFVTGRTPLGLMLTDLIKGGICKVELAQLLVAAIAGNDALERLRARGWADLTRELDAYYAECEHELHDHLVMLEFARPAGSLAGGAAAGLGSDVAVTSIRSPEATGPLDRNTMRILVSLAYRAEQGQPRLPAGKAVSYYAREFPEADYIFYCYGSSLLVARRLNQADLSLNLGAIMPELGGPGDGGHAGAAVCRPADNAFYPAAQLGQVAGGNFTRFAAYLAFRLQRLGYALTATRDLSRSTGDLSRGSIRLLLVTAAAVLAGALLVLCSARFERRAIVDSNADFFPQISSGAAVDDPFDAPEATPPVGAEEP